MNHLARHLAVDALRTVAELIDSGLPVPIGITPTSHGHPTLVQVQPADSEEWATALGLSALTWERKPNGLHGRSGIALGIQLSSYEPEPVKSA